MCKVRMNSHLQRLKPTGETNSQRWTRNKLWAQAAGQRGWQTGLRRWEFFVGIPAGTLYIPGQNGVNRKRSQRVYKSMCIGRLI